MVPTPRKVKQDELEDSDAENIADTICSPCDGSEFDPCCPPANDTSDLAQCDECGHCHGSENRKSFHHNVLGHVQRLSDKSESKLQCALAHLANLANVQNYARLLLLEKVSLWKKLAPLLKRRKGIKFDERKGHAFNVLWNLAKHTGDLCFVDVWPGNICELTQMLLVGRLGCHDGYPSIRAMYVLAEAVNAHNSESEIGAKVVNEICACATHLTQSTVSKKASVALTRLLGVLALKGYTVRGRNVQEWAFDYGLGSPATEAKANTLNFWIDNGMGDTDRNDKGGDTDRDEDDESVDESIDLEVAQILGCGCPTLCSLLRYPTPLDLSELVLHLLAKFSYNHKIIGGGFFTSDVLQTLRDFINRVEKEGASTDAIEFAIVVIKRIWPPTAGASQANGTPSVDAVHDDEWDEMDGDEGEDTDVGAEEVVCPLTDKVLRSNRFKGTIQKWRLDADRLRQVFQPIWNTKSKGLRARWIEHSHAANNAEQLGVLENYLARMSSHAKRSFLYPLKHIYGFLDRSRFAYRSDLARIVDIVQVYAKFGSAGLHMWDLRRDPEMIASGDAATIGLINDEANAHFQDSTAWNQAQQLGLRNQRMYVEAFKAFGDLLLCELSDAVIKFCRPDEFEADLLHRDPCDTSGYCAHCGKQATKKCQACQLVRYCSRECQVAAWPAHKRACRSRSLTKDR